MRAGNGSTAASGNITALMEQLEARLLLDAIAPNQPPTFTAGGNLSINTNEAAQVIPNWAKNISPGPAEESGQTLTFNVISDSNRLLFYSPPEISADGTLSFTPAPNARGLAVLTVVLKDNGGVSNGGVDTSAPQTFKIMVGAGDANVDGYVDGCDFSLLLTSWHTAGASWSSADFTGDGYVDALDFSLLLTNWHVKALSSSEQGRIYLSDSSLQRSQLPEGGQATVDVRLSQAPLRPVTITFTSAGDGDISISGPTSLTFNALNYNIYQHLVLSAGQDVDDVNSTATITATGEGYISGTLPIVEQDDEPAYVAPVDAFDADTTNRYEALFWPSISGQSAIPSLSYDSLNRRAIVRTEGSPGWTLMRPCTYSPVTPANEPFDFGADISVPDGSAGALYLGDLRDIGLGTYVMFGLDKSQPADSQLYLEVVKSGVSVESRRIAYSGSQASLDLQRRGDVYSFFCDDQLVWQEPVAAFDESQNLSYGVAQRTTSGSALSQLAVDDWRWAGMLRPTMVQYLSVPQCVYSTHASLSPDGSRLFFTACTYPGYTNANLYAFDTSTMSIDGTLLVGGVGSGLALSPDGSVGYITETGQWGLRTTKFDANGLTVLQDSMPVYSSGGVVFSPDGDKVYIGPQGILDVATGTYLGRLACSTSGPTDMAMTPDGQYVYVVEGFYLPYTLGKIYKVSTATNEVVSTINLNMAHYAWPRIKMLPDGSGFVVSGTGDQMLHIYSVADDREIQVLDYEPYSDFSLGFVNGLDVSQDGDLIALTLEDDNHVLIFSREKNRCIASLHVPSEARSVTFSPDASRIYVTGNSSDRSGSPSSGWVSVFAFSDDAPFMEGFGGYPILSWPVCWTAGGNALTDKSGNTIVSSPFYGLQLYGVPSPSFEPAVEAVPASAYHPCSFREDFSLRLRIHNGSEDLSPWIPNSPRAYVGMSHGSSGDQPSRQLIKFSGDGKVLAADGSVLTTYQTRTTYDVRIDYHRSGTSLSLHYWLNGADVGSRSLTIIDLEAELSLDHLELKVFEGSATFGDIIVI